MIRRTRSGSRRRRESITATRGIMTGTDAAVQGAGRRLMGGIAASPTSPWWVSDNGTSKSTLYDGTTSAKVPLTVTVPGPPTGVVFNGSAADFKVQVGAADPVAARFIFATVDGQIAGWNGQ